MRYKTLFPAICLLLTGLVCISYSDDPPNGRTGAPFDGYCGNCHTTNNPGGYNGIAEIIGLPDTIQPNAVYPLQIKATVIAGNPVRAGFQLVVVDKHNHNAGDLMAVNNDADTEFFAGREYLDHRGGKYFNNGPVSWSFTWTAPAEADCNTLKFYYIVNFCNGGGDFGDFPIAFADSVYFAGSPSLSATATTLQHNTCLEDNLGIAQVQATGGAPPYQYRWSNIAMGATASALPAGNYVVTVLDNALCADQDSTIVLAVDTVVPLLQCPADVYACAQDTIQYDLPSVTDNCALNGGAPVLLNGLSSGTVFPPGTTVQVFQAADASGNTATCNFAVHIHAPPVITLDTLLHDIGMTGSGGIFTTVETGDGGSHVTYTWEKDGLFFAAGTGDINGLFAGDYSLEVRDSLGCSAILGSLIVDDIVSENYPDNRTAQFALFPQPVTGTSFYFRGIATAINTIEMLNIQAQVVQVFAASDWPGPFYVDKLADGFYLVKITMNSGKTHVLKCIKTR